MNPAPLELCGAERGQLLKEDLDLLMLAMDCHRGECFSMVCCPSAAPTPACSIGKPQAQGEGRPNSFRRAPGGAG